MGLRIAKDAGLTNVVSVGEKPYRKKSDLVQVDAIPAGQESLYEANPAYNPLLSQHPIAGSTVETKYYLFNNEAAKRYEGINLDSTDATGADESGWLFLAPDNAGAAGTYLAASVALAMADVSDASVAKPFWVKVVAPAVGAVQNKTDIKLTINFTEFAK